MLMWKNFKVTDADAQCMSRSIFGNATSSLNIEIKSPKVAFIMATPWKFYARKVQIPIRLDSRLKAGMTNCG